MRGGTASSGTSIAGVIRTKGRFPTRAVRVDCNESLGGGVLMPSGGYLAAKILSWAMDRDISSLLSKKM